MRVHRAVLLMASAAIAAAVQAPVLTAQAGADIFATMSDGVKIRYVQLGSRGTPVVLIHGFSSDLERNWLRTGIAAALSGNHRVIAFDMRGHGRSEKPHDPSKYSTDRFALDAFELMDQLGIQKAHIGGYSMGGDVVRVMMSMAPTRFITAYLGGAGIDDPDPAKRAADAALDRQGTDPGDAAAIAEVQNRPNDRVALQAVQSGRAAAPTQRAPVDLSTFPAPLLFVVGELDRPNAKTAYAKRTARTVEVTVVQGRSHLGTRSSPEQRDALARFIGTHDQP
jgi:pimeloyl-ACP methyl ester carboxylesterase